MTTFDVTLSSALQTELDHPGVWADAVYFTSGGPVWHSLVSNGSIAGSGTVDISLPSSLNAGKVYFLVESLGTVTPAPTADPLQAAITQESDINWGNAASLDFGYDSFELTLLGNGSDVGNLTSVNGFGLPIGVSVPYSNGTTASAGYKVSGGTIANDIANLNTLTPPTFNYSSGPLSGSGTVTTSSIFRIAESPTEAVGGSVANPAFSAADWSGYVTSLEGTQASSIELSGQFNGAPDANGVWHNGGYFAYQLQWNGADAAFWLTPLAGSQIQGAIEITANNLENSIYSTLGTAEIYTATSDPSLFLSMNTGANNQWGKVLSDLLTGFTAGFYNETGKSLNPQISTPIDLNNNTNWDPTYAFDSNLASTPPTTYQVSDPYSKIFFDNSNSYGSGYSDALMQQYATGGPLLSLWDTKAAADVSNINLTLYANGETPAGYTTPVIDNYITPAAGGYAAALDLSTADTVTFNFASSVADNAGVVMASTDTVTLSFLTSDTSAGGGLAPGWATVSFDGATAGPLGLWQNWAVVEQSGTYVAVPNGGVAQPVGSILIGGFPVADNGISWYQIGVGGKTFNLYTTTSGGQFENPNDPATPNALAVDGLAIITPPAPASGKAVPPTIPTFTVNFASNAAVTYASSLMVPNAANVTTLTAPDAPVAGTVAGGVFSALAGQTNEASNTITTDSHDIAFAWTGANNAPGADATAWSGGYTNKIDGLDITRVTITPASGSGTITTTATANIDGAWTTGTVDLTNAGTYTVSMAEYLPTDTTFATPLTQASSPLVLNEVAAPPCFVAGTPIRTLAGELPVEHLTVGMALPTAGGRGAARVIWIGQRTLDCRRQLQPAAVMPVRIRRDAFGPGRPATDILLSPDHAVFVDGVLIPVRYLVNGATICRQPADH